MSALPELSQYVPLIQSATPFDRRQCNNRGLTQAYELRDLAANLAIALKAELTQPDGKLTITRDEFGKPVDAPAIAQLIRAWSEAREAIRILRGRPLPGSLRPERKPSRAKKRSSPSLYPRDLPADNRTSKASDACSASLAAQPPTPAEPELPKK